jgi:hypothetical protein
LLLNKYSPEEKPLLQISTSLESIAYRLRNLVLLIAFALLIMTGTFAIVFREYVQCKQKLHLEYLKTQTDFLKLKNEGMALLSQVKNSKGDILAIDKKDGKYVIEIIGEENEQP